jgi:predicted transcriptional regulator
MGKKKRYKTIQVDSELKEVLDKYKLVHNSTHSDILKKALKESGIWEEYVKIKKALEDLEAEE